MKSTTQIKIIGLALSLSTLLISGCSKTASSGGSGGAPAATSSGGTISGVVQNNYTAGAVSTWCKLPETMTSADVALTNDIMAGTAECPADKITTTTTTDSNGSFSATGLPVGTFAVITKGGTYASEVDGSTVTPTADVHMIVYSDGTKGTLAVTPVAEMAAKVAWAGMATALQDGGVVSNVISSEIQKANVKVATMLGISDTTVDFTKLMPPDPNKDLALQGVSADSVNAMVGNYLVSFEKARIDEVAHINDTGYKPLQQRMADALTAGTSLAVDPITGNNMATVLQSNIQDMKDNPGNYQAKLSVTTVPTPVADTDKIDIATKAVLDKKAGIVFDSAKALDNLNAILQKLSETEGAVKKQIAAYKDSGAEAPKALSDAYTMIEGYAKSITAVTDADTLDIKAAQDLLAIDWVARVNGFMGNQGVFVNPNSTQPLVVDTSAIKKNLSDLYAALKNQYAAFDKLAGQYVTYSQDIPAPLQKGMNLIKDFAAKVNTVLSADTLSIDDAKSLLQYNWVSDLNNIIGKLETPKPSASPSQSPSDTPSVSPSPSPSSTDDQQASLKTNLSALYGKVKSYQVGLEAKISDLKTNGKDIPQSMVDADNFINGFREKVNTILSSSPIDPSAAKEIMSTDWYGKFQNILNPGSPTPSPAQSVSPSPSPTDLSPSPSPSPSTSEAAVTPAKAAVPQVLLDAMQTDPTFQTDFIAVVIAGGDWKAMIKARNINIYNDAAAMQFIANQIPGILVKFGSSSSTSSSSSSVASSSSSMPPMAPAPVVAAPIDCTLPASKVLPACMAPPASSSSSSAPAPKLDCALAANMVLPACMAPPVSSSSSSAPAGQIDCSLPASMVLAACMSPPASSSSSSAPKLDCTLPASMSLPACMAPPPAPPASSSSSSSSAPAGNIDCSMMANMANPACMAPPPAPPVSSSSSSSAPPAPAPDCSLPANMVLAACMK